MLRSTTFPRGVSTLHTDASGTAPPDAFGPFRVLHQIGAGVLGPVYRAYQPDPGRLVAVKQFRLDLPPEGAHRFVAALERLIAADLTYLGIAAPLAAGMIDNTPYLALDFVAAESFDVVIRDYGPAPVAEALRIATQLGGALDFSAAVNVWHGALHPRDVLVSTDDTRVTGLGIAQALEQVGVAPPVRRPYTAPERLAGAAWDRRADTFSLAALVYEMLFGRRIPGPGHVAADAIGALEGTDLDALRALFARALAEDPADRFDTALAFADALHSVVSQPARPAKAGRTRRKRDLDAAPRREPGSTLPLEPAVDLPLMIVADQPATAPPFVEPHEPSNDPIEIAGEREEIRSQTAPPAPEASFSDIPSDSSPATAGAPHPGGPSAIDASELVGAPFDDLEPFTDAAHDEDVEVLRPAIDAADDRLGRAALREAEPPDPTEPASRLPDMQTLSSAALEQSRSAVWPIVLALVVGLSVGFAGGYGLRERSAAAPAAATAPVAGAAAPTREVPAQTPPASPPVRSAPADPAAAVAPPASAPAPGRGSAPAASRPATAAAPEPAAPIPRRPAAAERAAAQTGRVAIRSTPSGARVTLDGRAAGVTPLTLGGLARGSHVVRITHQGYVAAERRVRIRDTQTAQSIEVALVATRAVREAAPPPTAPERSSGSLMVDSRPAGARVFVDGRLVGTTPLLLDAIAVGDHGVRLELDGFNPWTATTNVAGGERARVSGSLEQR
ncbi:MAG TPA: PEGA domain-containing protein [Vicinamibacterales bacterium]|nr:PEGA domain-containing protein [Vicinamibacterales bacterium]